MALAQQRNDDAGQHVAHAAAGHAGIAAAVDGYAAVRCGDDGAGAFEDQVDAEGSGEPPGCGDAVGFHAGDGYPQQAGHLSRMGGEHHGGAFFIEEAVRVLGHGIQAVGIDHQGENGRFHQGLDQGNCSRVPAQARADGQGILTGEQPFDGGECVVGEVAVAGIGQGYGHGLGGLDLQDRVEALRDRQGHQAGTGPHGAVGGERGSTGLAARAGYDQAVAEVPLVGLPVAAAQQGTDAVDGEEFTPIGLFNESGRDADVGHHQAAGVVGARIQDMPQFGGSKGHGDGCPHRAAQHPAGAAVDAGRDVHRHNRAAGGIDQFDRLPVRRR